MTAKEAKQLLVQTVVMFSDDPEDLGFVKSHNPHGFYVNWVDGEESFIGYKYAKHISIYQPSESIVLGAENKED